MALTVMTCARGGCSRPVGPRARYCRNACRQAAYRERRARSLAIMTRDLFEEVLQEDATDEQREAYAALVERFPEFRALNGEALFRSALPREGREIATGPED